MGGIHHSSHDDPSQVQAERRSHEHSLYPGPGHLAWAYPLVDRDQCDQEDRHHAEGDSEPGEGKRRDPSEVQHYGRQP